RQHIAFEVSVEGYPKWIKKIEEAGIKILHRQKWKKGKLESFYFEDPDKHLLEIVPEGIWE
ncbi:glyoxalase, partial [Cytophagales bacterium RKSG123]